MQLFVSKMMVCSVAALALVGSGCGPDSEGGDEAAEIAARQDAIGSFAIDWPTTIGRVPKVSGGDCDIYTKKGRNTEVEVTANNMSIVNGNQICLDVLYRVAELSSNYTTLLWAGRVCSPVQYGLAIRALGYAVDYSVKVKYPGVNHGWNALPQVPDAIVTSGSARIDGSGCDDTGNAALNLSFHVPVMADLVM